MSQFAPAGLLESMTDEERRQFQSQQRQAMGMGLLAGSPMHAHQAMQQNTQQARLTQQERQRQAQFAELVAGTEGLDPHKKAIIAHTGDAGKLLTHATAASERQRTEAQEQTKREQYAEFVANLPINDHQKRIMLQLGYEDGMDYVTEQANVGSGQARVDAFGNVVHEQPTSTQSDWMFGQENPGFAEQQAGPTESQSVRDAKIADARRLNPDLPERVVTGIVDGQIQVRQDPETGRNFVVDPFTQEQHRVRTVGEGERPPPRGEASVDRGVDVAATTGLPGVGRRLVNTVADIMGGGAPAEETSRAVVELSNFVPLTKMRLARSIAKQRVSQQFLDQIDDMFPNPRGVLQGTDDAKRRLEALGRLFDQEVARQNTVLDNEGAHSASTVAEAYHAAEELMGVREDINIMLEGFGKGGSRPGDFPAEDPELESLLDKYAPREQ